MKIKQKKKKILIYSAAGIAILVLAVFISFRPFALVPTNGGGEYIPLPEPEPYPLPIPPPPPSAPTLQSIAPNPDNDGSISLVWSIISGASYKVYMSKDGGTWETIKTTGIFAYVHHGLTNGVYRFRVKSYNTYGYSVYSNIRSVTVSIPELEPEPIPGPIAEVPEAPVLKDIVPSVSTSGEIDLEWNAVSGATKYTIYRSKDGQSLEILKENFEENSYSDLVLDSGTYEYKVKAGNSEGYSDYSNVEGVSVNLPNVPEAPETGIINYNFIGENLEISFSWNEVDCDSYNLYRSIDGGDYILIEENTISTTYSEVLTERGLYSYKVSAVNINGESTLSVPTEINWPKDGNAPEIPGDSTITIIIVVIGLGVGGLVTIYFLSKKLKK